MQVVLNDRPAAAIMEYVRREGMDLIALSTRGRGGIVRLLLGSAAYKVVRGADMPVLVYRPVEIAEQGQPAE